MAGVSDTANAAAWAKRLEPPVTKLSKLYLGFNLVSKTTPTEPVFLGYSSDCSDGADPIGNTFSGVSETVVFPSISGLTTTAKLVGPPMRASSCKTSRMSVRIRCSNIPRVRSFGTSKYKVSARTPFGSTKVKKPISWGLRDPLVVSLETTDDHCFATSSSSFT
ncbi:unannotated protein [freshwater metagenome]|uniref:Unannotated protein n=1 Tax=freshwater metagenome TaxID=449393 RepID=A0A6J7CW60_9ZZZZ